MSFPLTKKNLTDDERFFFDHATSKSTTTIERVRMAILLAEAKAAKQEYVFKWTHHIQRGWTCEIFIEPYDLGRPQFITSEKNITLNPKLDREIAQELHEAQMILSLMSAESRKS